MNAAMLVASLLFAQPAAVSGTAGRPALTLPDAVGGALERSSDLRSAMLSLESAALSPARFDDAFATNAFAEGGVHRDELPRRSPFQGNQITSVPVSAGVSRLFPTGTILEASADASWFESPSPNFGGFPISQIESGWTQGVTVTARHPVWGVGQEEVLALQKSQATSEIAGVTARTAESLDQVLGEVHRRFWSWALAEEALRNADEGVRATEDTRAEVQRKAKRGLADERDTLRVAAAVQQARDQRIAAERAIDATRRVLFDRIGATGNEWGGISYDLSTPVEEVPLETVVKRAEESSLTLRALESAREAQHFTLAIAAAQQRGRVFAVGRFREETLFPDGSAFDTDIGYTAYLGLRWERRFGNAASDVSAKQASLELRRIDADIARTKEVIRVAAAEHEAAIRSARVRVESAEELVRIQEKRHAEERRNFDIGRSFLRDVIEARQQVTAARFQLAAARVALRMAATERELLAGSLTGPWRDRLAESNPAYRTVVKVKLKEEVKP